MPLTDLSKGSTAKDSPWMEKEEAVFEALKDALTLESGLRHRRMDQQFVPNCSQHRIGTVQQRLNGPYRRQHLCVIVLESVRHTLDHSVPRPKIIRTIYRLEENIVTPTIVQHPGRIQVLPKAMSCIAGQHEREEHERFEIRLHSFDSTMTQEQDSEEIEVEFLKLFTYDELQDGKVWSNVILRLEIVCGNLLHYDKVRKFGKQRFRVASDPWKERKESTQLHSNLRDTADHPCEAKAIIHPDGSRRAFDLWEMVGLEPLYHGNKYLLTAIDYATSKAYTKHISVDGSHKREDWDLNQRLGCTLFYLQ